MYLEKKNLSPLWRLRSTGENITVSTSSKNRRKKGRGRLSGPEGEESTFSPGKGENQKVQKGDPLLSSLCVPLFTRITLKRTHVSLPTSRKPATGGGGKKGSHSPRERGESQEREKAPSTGTRRRGAGPHEGLKAFMEGSPIHNP